MTKLTNEQQLIEKGELGDDKSFFAGPFNNILRTQSLEFDDLY